MFIKANRSRTPNSSKKNKRYFLVRKHKTSRKKNKDHFSVGTLGTKLLIRMARQLVHNFQVVIVFAQGIQHRLVGRIEFAILEERAQHLAGESRDHGHILFLLRDWFGAASTSQVPEDDT